ncbi:glycoside hydrolase family 63 protein [Cavenderia fasciculata]|uniref:Mannosyl-oligosaccharide glucosidase n=1 Tax=Cavenderia fasciculata TaxID=261658 RepID=F4PJM8_CACFS|nr:glycoside hydrolase family 63 protein [Cavenderia fasciculata]EGG23802.1 glycoside hydrolase family 63 protein [Cavenderia fasciculata]|eukprot:XP_004361653.1 glycoside hydrolase family 63 protein [Cavenderia fasciculata]
MIKYFLIILLLLPIVIYCQEVLMKVSIFDHHPAVDGNFEPPTAGKVTRGMVKSSLDIKSKIPELVSLDPANKINIGGNMYVPQNFKYFFSPDYTPSKINRYLNTSILLAKKGDYYEYKNDFFFPIDGTSSAKLGFDAEGYKLYYDVPNANQYHNYHFCLKMNSFFKFRLTSPPMQFNFRGDDDVWVYINNKLAMDLGGLHYYADGSIVFDTMKAQELGLTDDGVYSFDFYYCERQTTGSHMGFQINFPLDCSQTDYCGVCNGAGECCDVNKACVKYAGNKCMDAKCPAWNTNIPDLSQMSNYCVYTNRSYDSMNDKCSFYTCDPATGNPKKNPSPCDKLPCQSSTCTNGAVGCVYTPTCVPANSCEVVKCAADGVTCNRSPKTCTSTDVCKKYSCDTSRPDGCTSQPTCPTVIVENGVVNKCKYGTCNPANTTNPCVINEIANCNDCSGTPNPCQVLDKCISATGKWTFKDNPEINDNDPCNKDLCDIATGVITHPYIACPGTCSRCNASDGAYACKLVNSLCEDSNACTTNTCSTNGTCLFDPIKCPADPDKCSFYTCDKTKGCTLQSVTCPDEGNCQVGYCDKSMGCLLRPRNCTTAAYCLEGYCDERLGCLSLNRTCTPNRPQCQVGICNNQTETCEYHDRDPYPFVCKTAAVVSTAVIAGVVVAGAVALGLAVFGGKKGYDYWKTQRAGKIGAANANPFKRCSGVRGSRRWDNVIETGKEGLNEKLYWGTYKPHLYHALKSRSKQPITAGLIWSVPNIDKLYTRYLHRVGGQAIDGVERYEWIRHDGYNYGEQEIEDKAGNLKLIISFIKKDKTNWSVRVSGSQLNTTKPVPMTSLFYYIQDESMTDQKDGKGLTYSQTDGVSKGEKDVYIDGSHPELGRYTMTLSNLDATNTPKSSMFLDTQPSVQDWRYYGQSETSDNRWDIPTVMFDESTKEHIQSYYSKWLSSEKKQQTVFVPTLPNIVEKNSNLLVVQRVLTAPFNVEISFTCHGEKELSQAKLKETFTKISRTNFDEIWDQHNRKFETKYELKFPVNKFVTDEYRKFGKIVLSNMFGGIGFWSGNIQYRDPITNKIQIAPDSTLFGTTPSRAIFGRPFLWDEGLHQLVVGHFDSDMSLEILSSWLNTMDANGWIAHDQILDREIASFALENNKNEDIVQSPRVLNPPTILMAIDRLIDQVYQCLQGTSNTQSTVTSDCKNESARILEFLRAAYPRLGKYYQYFWDTLESDKVPKLFSWKMDHLSKSNLKNGTAVLIASGMTDYPRCNFGSCNSQNELFEQEENYLHLDAAAWVAYAAGRMARIAETIKESSQDYRNDKSVVLEQLKKYHWDPYTSKYYDVKITTTKPTIKVEKVDVYGILNFMPLLLGLEDSNDRYLLDKLNAVKDIRGLWSRHGLRSLAVRDPYFNSNNHEWRGAIWINYNYILTNAIHTKYMVEPPKAAKISFYETYHSLRHNLVHNVYLVYRDSGFIWEQYHSIEGNGQGAHPFCGSTSLVLLILSDQFSLTI